METISLAPDLRGIFKWIMRMPSDERLNQLCLWFPNIEAGTLMKIHTGELLATITEKDGKFTFRTDEAEEDEEEKHLQFIRHIEGGE